MNDEPTTDDINLIFAQAEHDERERRKRPVNKIHRANRELQELRNRKPEPDWNEVFNHE